ncbi:MAG: transposase [Gammaproteobacteria bacterium]|nr:transposase [Gammaproteobacteria bacterium]
MPRTARAMVGGICYHVINRGNARATVYHEPRDYDAFLTLMTLACERIPMRILAYCLMPNHFHLVLWSYCDGDISRWMHWLLTAHTKRHHRIRRSSGRVWQGRFKAFPIQQDRHLLTVMRYVERNSLRAGLVQSATDWEWSSLSPSRVARVGPPLTESPVTKPNDWPDFVGKPHSQQEIDALRRCSAKNAPYGSDTWTRSTAKKLGLLSSLRRPGRPKRGHS